MTKAVLISDIWGSALHPSDYKLLTVASVAHKLVSLPLVRVYWLSLADLTLSEALLAIYP